MKTLKEILLERNAGMEGKLDAVRGRALEAISRPSPADRWRDLWSGMRGQATALGAAWAVICLLNCDQNPKAPRAENKAAPSAQVILSTLREHRKELIELTEAPADPEDPAAALEQRSEKQNSNEIA
ncbi:MAG: hypothetical protein ACLQVY_27895 [Limisphaerales bacterium]